jgi:hypothetical protein
MPCLEAAYVDAWVLYDIRIARHEIADSRYATPDRCNVLVLLPRRDIVGGRQEGEEEDDEEEEESRSCGDEVRHNSDGSGPGLREGSGRGVAVGGEKCTK